MNTAYETIPCNICNKLSESLIKALLVPSALGLHSMPNGMYKTLALSGTMSRKVNA